MTPKQILRKAAEIMESSQTGACSAIAGVNMRRSWAVSIDTNEAECHFAAMFRPKLSSSATFWFGGGKAQCELTGLAERKARDHRVYALLLAAESWEG